MISEVESGLLTDETSSLSESESSTLSSSSSLPAKNRSFSFDSISSSDEEEEEQSVSSDKVKSLNGRGQFQPKQKEKTFSTSARAEELIKQIEKESNKNVDISINEKGVKSKITKPVSEEQERQEKGKDKSEENNHVEEDDNNKIDEYASSASFNKETSLKDSRNAAQKEQETGFGVREKLSLLNGRNKAIEKVSELEKEILLLKDRNIVLESEKKDLQEHLNRAEQNLSGNSLAHLIKSLLEEVKSSNIQDNSFRVKITDLATEISNQDRIIASFQKENEKLLLQLKVQQKKFNEVVSQAVLNQHKTSTSAENDDKFLELESKFKDEKGKWLQDKLELEGTIMNLKNELETLRKDIKNKERISLVQNIEVLQKEIFSLKSDLKQKAEDNFLKSAEIANMKTKSSANDSIRELNVALQEKDSVIASLKSEIMTLEKKLELRMKQSKDQPLPVQSRALITLPKTQEKFHSLSKQINSLNEKIQKLLKVIKQRELENSTLRQKLEELEIVSASNMIIQKTGHSSKPISPNSTSLENLKRVYERALNEMENKIIDLSEANEDLSLKLEQARVDCRMLEFKFKQEVSKQHPGSSVAAIKECERLRTEILQLREAQEIRTRLELQRAREQEAESKLLLLNIDESEENIKTSEGDIKVFREELKDILSELKSLQNTVQRK